MSGSLGSREVSPRSREPGGGADRTSDRGPINLAAGGAGTCVSEHASTVLDGEPLTLPEGLGKRRRWCLWSLPRLSASGFGRFALTGDSYFP